jgi:hypothetical protein
MDITPGLEKGRVRTVSALTLSVRARFNATATNYESGGREFESLRARQKPNIHQHNLNTGKDAMQNKIICMASAWQKERATRLHEALKLVTNGGQHVRIVGR